MLKDRLLILSHVFVCLSVLFTVFVAANPPALAFVTSINPLVSFSSPQVFIAAVTSILFVDQIFPRLVPLVVQQLPLELIPRAVLGLKIETS